MTEPNVIWAGLDRLSTGNPRHFWSAVPDKGGAPRYIRADAPELSDIMDLVRLDPWRIGFSDWNRKCRAALKAYEALK